MKMIIKIKPIQIWLHTSFLWKLFSCYCHYNPFTCFFVLFFTLRLYSQDRDFPTDTFSMTEKSKEQSKKVKQSTWNSTVVGIWVLCCPEKLSSKVKISKNVTRNVVSSSLDGCDVIWQFVNFPCCTVPWPTAD